MDEGPKSNVDMDADVGVAVGPKLSAEKKADVGEKVG